MFSGGIIVVEVGVAGVGEDAGPPIIVSSEALGSEHGRVSRSAVEKHSQSPRNTS